MAGHAPLGGARETALSCFLIARLVDDACRNGEGWLSAEQRRARAQGARHWLGSTTIPAQIRAALTKLAECSGEGDRKEIRNALVSVMTVTANQLEPAAGLELGRLAQTIAG
jgi:hypothetical protein